MLNMSDESAGCPALLSSPLIDSDETPGGLHKTLVLVWSHKLSWAFQQTEGVCFKAPVGIFPTRLQTHQGISPITPRSKRVGGGIQQQLPPLLISELSLPGGITWQCVCGVFVCSQHASHTLLTQSSWKTQAVFLLEREWRKNTFILICDTSSGKEK